MTEGTTDIQPLDEAQSGCSLQPNQPTDATPASPVSADDALPSDPAGMGDDAADPPVGAVDVLPSDPVSLGEALLAHFTTFENARRNKEEWALDEAVYGKKTSAFRDTHEPEHPLILVVHASVGSGHRSAAIGVAQALEKLRDSQQPALADGSPMDPDTQIAVVDILAWGEHQFDGNRSASMFTGFTRPYYDITWRYTFTGRILWGGGTFLNYLLWRKWTRFIGHAKPLAVVATHIMGANMTAGARAMCGQDFPLVCVPTDYETEGLWPHKEADVFCVGTQAMAETLRARKIHESRIRITGIPTRQDFLEQHDTEAVRKQLGIPTDDKLILALAGAHLPQPYVNMRKLIAAALPAASSHPHMHMVLVCGKDEAYKAEVQAIADDYGLKNVHVVGYADEVAALMEASDVIVCKAGGLTVTECLCVGTPMILVGRAYGQEKINVAMLTSSGAATHVTTSRELIGILDALEDTPERLQTLTVNANLLRRPHAADEIAQLTLQLASKGHAHSGEESDLNSAAERSETPRMSRKWFFRVYTGHKPAHIR